MYAKILICFMLCVEVSKTIEETYRPIFAKDCILTFSASWCGPCKVQHRHNEVLKQHGFRVWQIDIDEHPELWNHLRTSTMVPFTCIIKKGKVVASWVGIVDYETIETTWKNK